MKLLLILLFSFSLTINAQNSLQRLEQSPRHHEWKNITYGERTVRAFVVYPEVAEKVPVVIVIHENRGLNDWARSMADQVAEAGYIAVAPDLLSGEGPGGGGTDSFENSDAARTAIYDLDPDQVTNDLDACVEYGSGIPAGNGKVAVVGFCWGGSQSFRFATNNSDIEAALVCYGSGPEDGEAYKRITAPVYGFYGGNDNRVNATIDNSEKWMNRYEKFYEPVIYEGAGHGFFRAGEAEDASVENKKGRDEGLKRMWDILGKL
jgi:carboxymethylenebutenolidase